VTISRVIIADFQEESKSHSALFPIYIWKTEAKEGRRGMAKSSGVQMVGAKFRQEALYTF